MARQACQFLLTAAVVGASIIAVFNGLMIAYWIITLCLIGLVGLRRLPLSYAILIAMLLVSGFVPVWTGPQEHISVNLHIAVWTVGLSLFALVHVPSAIIVRVLYGVGLANAVLALYQAFTGYETLTGMFDSPNPLAGSTVLAAVVAAHYRHNWALALLVVGLVASGSRWAFIIGMPIIMLMVATTDRRWLKWAAASILVGASIGLMSQPERAEAKVTFTPERHISDVQRRLTLPEDLEAMPSGMITFGEASPHNVPLRLGVEWGLVAAAAYVGLVCMGLWRGWDKPLWWVFLALAGLNLMDYYAFLGPLGWAFWLVLGAIISDRVRDGSNPIRLRSRWVRLGSRRTIIH